MFNKASTILTNSTLPGLVSRDYSDKMWEILSLQGKLNDYLKLEGKDSLRVMNVQSSV